MSISSKIQSLITAANSVTGESRTDLTSAVQDLKDGYGQGGGGLPSEYEAVEYIETTGGQWINTGILHSEWNQFYGEFSLSSIGTYTQILCGSQMSVSGNMGMAVSNKLIILSAPDVQNKMRIGYSGYWEASGQSALTANQKYKIAVPWFRVASQNIDIDGGNGWGNYIRQANSNYQGDPDNNTYPLYLFTTGRDGQVTSGDSFFFVGKFYGGTFMFDFEKVRDFVPCIRKSDSEAGLYDLVNGVFYTNQGTGDFVVPT